jgi:hypothetical protein
MSIRLLDRSMRHLLWNGGVVGQQILIGCLFQEHALGPFLLQKLKVLILLFLLHHFHLALEQLQGGASIRWKGLHLVVAVTVVVIEQLLGHLLPEGRQKGRRGRNLRLTLLRLLRLLRLLLLLSNNRLRGDNRSSLGRNLGYRRHGELGTSVLAEHLSRKLGLIPKEELMVVGTKLGSTGNTDEVPVKKR